jgi:mRNA-degrading endonuclease toxin of MazEF toxin-antitoxin module
MRQWDIWKFPFPEPIGAHWVVILSNDERCRSENFATVNALFCSTLRPATRTPDVHEVVLNGSDGFERRTVVRCDVFYLLEKSKLQDRVGAVTAARRRQIAKAIAVSLRLPSPWN